jgi:hypothetical protein
VRKNSKEDSLQGPCSHAGEASLKASASSSPTIFCSSSFFLLSAEFPQEEVVEWLQITPFSSLSGALALPPFVFFVTPTCIVFRVSFRSVGLGFTRGSGFPSGVWGCKGRRRYLESSCVLSGYGCRSGWNTASGATFGRLPLSHCSCNGV